MRFPNLIIPGAQRAGTTSLVKNLYQHPDVWFPAIEVHFFDLYDDPNATGKLNNLEDYLNLYKGRDEKILGDKTPCYMYLKKTRDLMKLVLPGTTKFIICLRNPIDRAYSQYNKTERNEPFEKIIVDCLKRKQPKDRALLERGYYIDQLNSLFERFPKDNFHIVIQERMVESITKVLFEVYDFLGIEETLPEELFAYEGSDYEPMNDDTREGLRDHFQPGVFRLNELIDVDLTRYWTDF